MGVFDDDIATAKELIDEFGRTCYWQKPAPVTGGVPGYPTVGALPALIECKMAFFAPKDLDRGVQQFLDMIPGTEVPDNSQVALLAGGISFTPENADHIYFDTGRASGVSISKIDKLAPNGDAVLYFVTVAA